MHFSQNQWMCVQKLKSYEVEGGGGGVRQSLTETLAMNKTSGDVNISNNLKRKLNIILDYKNLKTPQQCLHFLKLENTKQIACQTMVSENLLFMGSFHCCNLDHMTG